MRREEWDMSTSFQEQLNKSGMVREDLDSHQSDSRDPTQMFSARLVEGARYQIALTRIQVCRVRESQGVNVAQPWCSRMGTLCQVLEGSGWKARG